MAKSAGSKKASTTKQKAVSPVDVPAYKPSLHLDGKQAQKLQKSHGVGKKVKMVVTATVAGHSVGKDWMDPTQKRHSTHLEIESMKPHKSKPKPKKP
jgi:hypothetical protein